ncbi:hypothetical protein [Coleofasciculus sp.]|uniref:hypothetical protein n=1 Tax=Coleofasciculus sp. TaxID=3100458 RepID=UPI0039F877FA
MSAPRLGLDSCDYKATVTWESFLERSHSTPKHAIAHPLSASLYRCCCLVLRHRMN